MTNKKTDSKYLTVKEFHRNTKHIYDLITSFRTELKADILEVKKDISEIKNDIVSFKDEILHEIIKLREDFVVITGYGDRIEDHEIRIVKLESKKPAN